MSCTGIPASFASDTIFRRLVRMFLSLSEAIVSKVGVSPDLPMRLRREIPTRLGGCRRFRRQVWTEMKDTVVSVILIVSVFVLFPYVGMLLRVTCDHDPTVTTSVRWLHRKHAIQLREFLLKLYKRCDSYVCPGLEGDPVSELNGSVSDILEVRI